MKQKNMALVAVAVVCGLIAAVLTSQMGAKGKTKVEEVMVPVAAKEILVGTRLPKEPAELAKWVKMKPVPKGSEPQGYIPTIEEMADKYVMQTRQDGDPFFPTFVSTTGMLAPPEGYGMMSLPIQADAAVSGFIRPGTHVDVWVSLSKKKSSQLVAFPMFLDMMILAVNQDATGPQAGGAQAYAGVSMVSVAVQPIHTELFQLAIARGTQMRLVMRHPDATKVHQITNMPAPDKIRKILTDEDEDAKPVSPVADAPKEEPRKPATVKVKVAAKDLAAQTELTADLIASAFRDEEFPADKVPENAIRNLKEHVGRYLQKDLAENQFLPSGYLGEKKSEVAPAPMIAQKEPTPEPAKPEPKKPGPGPDDVAGPKPEPEPIKPEPIKPKVKKPEYVDVTVTSLSGTRILRFVKLPNGELKKVGEVRPGDEPAAAPDEPKAEEKAREQTP